MSWNVGTRLTVVLIIVATVLLAISGIYGSWKTKTQLESRLEAEVSGVSLRLQGSLPSMLWNFDKAQIGKTIAAEMHSKAIVGLLVSADQGIVAGVFKGADDKVQQTTTAPQFEGRTAEVDLTFSEEGKNQKVGKVKVLISTSEMDTILQQNMIATIVQIIVLDVLLIVALSWAVNRVVLRPLKQARDALKNIASGDADLTRRLDESRKDEFGELSHWFNVFVERIRMVVNDVSDSALRLAAAADQTSRTSEQASANASRQVSEAENMLQHIRNVLHQLELVADSTGTAQQMVTSTVSQAEQGKNIIRETGYVINQLSQDVVSAANVIMQLDTEAQRIKTVLQVIEEIAGQTNLLALNAAIEAARAGEQGRGFAVVADEVRKLANRTAVSTGEIQEVIKRLLDGSRNAVQVMSSSRELADAGSEQTKRAEGAMETIVDAIAEVREVNDSIYSMTNEQKTLVHEVEGRVTNMQNTIHDSSTAAVETAAASHEQAKLAEGLQALVARFRI
ncbi:methyl-accepting chemotaxis protein [Chitinivorax tropicus]|uniref:Methyl-accepting chemotaxis protein n=1 Tax=Chitinivorax tropicus TaxID=714531 RepID=A0A840MU93_9PROT|nr:methyl-accepting chemotaxis protein [Chitinivorax tropicus]MBB5019936.1 methyl-accepting chemotaxis protein [Chitinivorax tropicus]